MNYALHLARGMSDELRESLSSKAEYVFLTLIEDMEIRRSTLTEGENEFLNLLKMIADDRQKFTELFKSFGRVLWGCQAAEDEISNQSFQSDWSERRHSGGCISDKWLFD